MLFMPMQNMIEQIVEMDTRAQKITEAAMREKLTAEQEIAAQTEELRRSYLKQSRRRLQMMNENERTIMEQRWKRRRNQYAAEQQRLEKVFSASREQWIREAVDRILQA